MHCPRLASRAPGGAGVGLSTSWHTPSHLCPHHNFLPPVLDSSCLLSVQSCSLPVPLPILYPTASFHAYSELLLQLWLVLSESAALLLYIKIPEDWKLVRPFTFKARQCSDTISAASPPWFNTLVVLAARSLRLCAGPPYVSSLGLSSAQADQ